jgi:hypothetical protein
MFKGNLCGAWADGCHREGGVLRYQRLRTEDACEE